MNDSFAYISQILGPQRSLSLEWMLFLTFVYVLLFITGAIGNVLVVIVILKFRFMRENMTNLYLANLAITDLLSVLAGMPLELYQLWHQYPWKLGHLACLSKSMILETTSCASVLTLVILTVERFRAICIQSDSLRAPQSSLSPSESLHMKRVAIRNILIIWLFSLMAATPLTVFTRINYLYLNGEPLPDSAWCGLPFNRPDRLWETFMIMSTVTFFIIPLIVISLLYFLIARTLKKANRIPNPGQFQLTDQYSSRKIMKCRTVVIRLLVAIVIAFTICWTPFHAQRLLFLYVTLYAEWTDHLREINQVLFLSAGVFYYLNSSINPILYSVMSTRFRAAFSLCVSDFFSHNSTTHSLPATAAAIVGGPGSTRITGQQPQNQQKQHHHHQKHHRRHHRAAGDAVAAAAVTAESAEGSIG